MRIVMNSFISLVVRCEYFCSIFFFFCVIFFVRARLTCSLAQSVCHSARCSMLCCKYLKTTIQFFLSFARVLRVHLRCQQQRDRESTLLVELVEVFLSPSLSLSLSQSRSLRCAIIMKSAAILVFLLFRFRAHCFYASAM